jgi:hypothetical protein
MSLRDFNAIDDRPFSLHTQPVGNESGLGYFHTVQPEDSAPSNTPKILGALVVALMIGAAGVGIYATSGPSSHPKPIAMANNQPSLPAVAAAPALDPSVQATKAAKAATTDPNSLRAALVKTPVSAAADNAPAPVKMKTASAKPLRSAVPAPLSGASARMATDPSPTSPQPQQQAVRPQPVSPVTSPSVAATTQPDAAVPAAPASDIPATSNSAPAPDQQNAPPAPAQPDAAGPVNQ